MLAVLADGTSSPKSLDEQFVIKVLVPLIYSRPGKEKTPETKFDRSNKKIFTQIFKFLHENTKSEMTFKAIVKAHNILSLKLLINQS